MRMDSEMNDILHLDFMHYMIVASLEMSDEPKSFTPKTRYDAQFEELNNLQ